MCASVNESTVRTLSVSTLVYDHGWRVILIVTLLATNVATASPSTLAGHAGCTMLRLALLLLLKTELTTAFRRKHLPPGDLGYPLIGEFLSLLFDPVRSTQTKMKQYGYTYTVNSLGLAVTFGDTEDIAWLWNTERKGRAQGFWPPAIRKLLGEGAVANTTGKRHRALRRLLEPAFAPNATRDYVTVIDETIQKSLEDWAKVDTFHSSDVFKIFALRLFFIAGFGRVPNDVIQQLHDDFNLWIQGFGSVIPFRLPGTQFAASMDARDRILAVVERLIGEFKQENSHSSERGQKSMMGRICYGTDENGDPMDMQELKDNILNMIFAGHDTTYASMGTTLHYLQEHPTIRGALAEEVRGFKEPLDFDEIKNAPVLNSFLAEAWRMDPPVAGAFRKTVKPLEYKGYTIPKDMTIQYSAIMATQNEGIYPSPSRFQIQRFLPKDHALSSDPSLHADGVDYNNMKANYPVFGGGSHACLGSHFAKLEMRILLTRMMQSYDLKVRCSEKVYFPVNGWKNQFKLEKEAKEMK